MSAESVLPWRPPTDGEHMGIADYRDIARFAGEDPYAYMGVQTIAAPHSRPTRTGWRPLDARSPSRHGWFAESASIVLGHHGGRLSASVQSFGRDCAPSRLGQLASRKAERFSFAFDDRLDAVPL